MARRYGPVTVYPCDMPSKARQRFYKQRSAARTRGIPWLFTPEAWWAWWQVDDRWSRRGRRFDDLVMARNGDAGPYAPDNVHCTTSQGNLAEIPREVLSRAHRRAYARGTKKAPHTERGEKHPRSRAVVTPAGAFGSAALAADHHGITRQHAARCARLGLYGWRYAEAAVSQDHAPLHRSMRPGMASPDRAPPPPQFESWRRASRRSSTQSSPRRAF